MLTPLLSTLSQYSAFSFSGSRNGSAAASTFIYSLASEFPSASVRVGCARGVDAIARKAFPSAAVFRAGMGRGALAARSARLVRASGSAGALLVAFPSTSFPPSGCVVGRSFRGGGSGTWGAVALALGLGFPVLVWCPSDGPSSPPPLPGLSVLHSFHFGSWWYSSGSVTTSYQPTLF